MFTDWIIIGALIVLVAGVVLFFTSGLSDSAPAADAQTGRADGAAKDLRARR